MPNDKNQLIPIYNNNHLIDYSIDNSKNNLSVASIKATVNAWTEGSLVDGIGQVWINEDALSFIWRTDNATANFFIDRISSRDKANFGTGLCIKYSAVIYRLNEIIQTPIKDKRREYLRVSDDIGRCVRDAPPVEVIQLKYKEFIDEIKRKLKSQRIKKYNILIDELTGEVLDIGSSEFHHIRRQSIYPEMISLIWNGLILNKPTHDILTQNNISDEYGLRDICINKNWSIEWFSEYEKKLNLIN
jgi:hypothetical protein